MGHLISMTSKKKKDCYYRYKILAVMIPTNHF